MIAYTNEEYAKAYTELLEVLKHIPKSSFNKIPKEKIEYYNLNKDSSYNFKYNLSAKFENQNISQLTRILIANIYTEYWTNDEEKEILKERDKIELEQLEEEKRQKYNPDDIFKDKKEKLNMQDSSNIDHDNGNDKIENTQMIIKEEKNIAKKIIEKIKKIFHLT